MTTFSISTYDSISNGLNYFFIFLMFFCLIGFSIFIICFSKWLTMGPKFKAKLHKIKSKLFGKKDFEGVVVKKGEVVVDFDYIKEVEEKIKTANTPQELLELQLVKDGHEKAKISAKEKIKLDEDSKLQKINDKSEKGRIRKEAKEQGAILKTEEKQNKALLKETKNKDKDK